MLQIVPVGFVEGAVVGAVDVEYGDDGAATHNRHHNLAVGGRRAGDVPRKLVHVRHNDRLATLPRGAANAPSVRDADAGYRPLERSEHQLIAHHPVEARPPETELLVQQRRHVGHLGNQVGLTRHQTLYLRQKRLVFLFFCHHLLNRLIILLCRVLNGKNTKN